MHSANGNLLDYLVKAALNNAPIPSIAEISKALNISAASLREQLEVARQLGLVDVKPKVGIQLRQYSLAPALKLSLSYGMRVKPELFEEYRDLRRHLELAYWHEAVVLLSKSDLDRMQSFVDQARRKISVKPIQVPQEEHRDFHMTLYRRLENTVVDSVLEAYWEMYINSDLNYYMNSDYLERVWQYHQEIVDALRAGEFEQGYTLLLAHMDLVQFVKKSELKQKFE